MARLNLVIADFDESYAKSLSSYINSNHSSAFMVSCFTKVESFKGYMEQLPVIDILMITSEFYEISEGLSRIKLKIILSSGTLNREYSEFQVISKYSTGEKLVSEVIYLYSKLNPLELRLPSNSKSAELIGIYSPAGGTGKTTIATALSIQCADMGMKAFYLNLESIQSTGAFFSTRSNRNLSYIFYYLKEKNKNLPFKMEGIKNIEDGVQYFNPPEGSMEYEEISAEELEQLILGIKDMGCYDCIFIDMYNNLDIKNLKIMNLCDHIVLVTLDEPISLYKNKVFFQELSKLGDANKNSISGKLINVINRYKGKGSEYGEGCIERPSYDFVIPEYTRTLIKEDGRIAVEDNDFRKAIIQIIDIITGK